ncbi:MAG: hypothetical protein AAGI48_08570 [Verrucomicrobiota bacterium]
MTMISGPHGFQARVLHWLKTKRNPAARKADRTAPTVKLHVAPSHPTKLRLPDNFDAFEAAEQSLRKQATLAPQPAPSAPRVSHRVRLKAE